MRMLGAFAKRMRQLVNLVESLSLKEVTARLARYLAEEAKRTSHTTLTLPISKATLAAFLGTIPETLSRSLHELENRGLISVQGKQIVIRNQLQLQQMAG